MGIKKKRIKATAEDMLLFGDDVRHYRIGECNAYCTIDVGLHHISISHEKRLPTWAEMRAARTLVPDEVTMAMLMPPESEYINLHQYCFHLWEVRDV
jgi:hypothetical protein